MTCHFCDSVSKISHCELTSGELTSGARSKCERQPSIAGAIRVRFALGARAQPCAPRKVGAALPLQVYR